MTIINSIKIFIVSILTLIGIVKVPATATPTNQVSTTPPSPTPVVRSVNSTKTISANWSGYAATGGTFTSVSGTWTIPKVSSTGNYGTDATWVGIGGIASRDLIQAGTMGEVTAGGSVGYIAFFETLPNLPQPVSLTVNGGDLITVNLQQQSIGQWQVSIKNNTTGKSVSFNDYYDSSLSSAEWIQEAPSTFRRVLPLDNFGTIQFSNCSAVENNQTVNLKASGATSITMADEHSGQTLASPSLLGTDGASFSITRTNYSNEQPNIVDQTERYRRGV